MNQKQIQAWLDTRDQLIGTYVEVFLLETHVVNPTCHENIIFLKAFNDCKVVFMGFAVLAVCVIGSLDFSMEQSHGIPINRKT